MWADAIGQIFFSIGVCMGIMTSYGSYNDKNKPIIGDNFIIAITNSGVSFVSGFAVWSVVGYLTKQKLLPKVPSGGVDLVFIAYPTAVDTLPGTSFWSVLLGLTLFLLGVDSAFAMVEAVATVLWDMPTFQNINRTLIAFALCLIGLIITTPFCTNWGFILFDVVDHYLAIYLLYVVGILQCFGCGWCYDWPEASDVKKTKALNTLTYGFWFILFVTGIWATAANNSKYGLLCFMGVIVLFIAPVSFIQADTTFQDWYDNVLMCGVHKLGYQMSKISRKATEGQDPDEKLWWEAGFVFYFGFCVKYLIPTCLWFMVLYSAKGDIEKPYGKYDAVWQWLGLIVPVIGLVIFFFNVCFCIVEEKLDDDAEDNEKVTGDKEPLAAVDNTIEMAEKSPNEAGVSVVR